MAMDWMGLLCAGGFAVPVTACLYLMTRHPWVSTFACVVGLGYILGNWMELDTRLQAKTEEVAELEKQVVVLKSAMHEMAVRSSQREAKYKRAKWLQKSEMFQSSMSL